MFIKAFNCCSRVFKRHTLAENSPYRGLIMKDAGGTTSEMPCIKIQNELDMSLDVTSEIVLDDNL